MRPRSLHAHPKQGRILWLCLLPLFASLLVSGCADESSVYQVGVSVRETSAPIYTLMQQGMENAGEPLGIEVVWHSVQQPPPDWWRRQWYRVAGWPPTITPLNREKAAVIRMINAGVDALVIQPVNVTEFDELFRRAQLAHVPLITVGDLPYNRRVTAHTEWDAIGMGEMAARFVVERVEGRGRVILLSGPSGDDYLRRVTVGMYHVLDPTTLHVLERRIAKRDPDAAFVTVNDLLTRYAGNIQAVLACDSELSEGVVRAVHAHGLEERIVTAGVGASHAATQRMQERPEQGGIAWHDMEVEPMPYEWGQKLMTALASFLSGEARETLAYDELRQNGEVETPVLYAPFQQVTPDNVRILQDLWPDLFSER